MEIRAAEERDLSRILEIYDHARSYMREQGNPHQWNGGYPSKEVLLEDISLSRLFVCVEGDEILGVFCYFYGVEPTYRVIEDGAWCNDLPYGVIHRIAVAGHCRGVASFCFAHCFSLCKNLKIDTHRDNIPMQKALAKNGFVRCGIIHLQNGDERIAYQKI